MHKRYKIYFSLNYIFHKLTCKTNKQYNNLQKNKIEIEQQIKEINIESDYKLILIF